MSDLRDILSSSTIIKTTFNIVKESGQKAYLVGGTIRDILIKSCIGNDFDFAVQGNGTAFAKSFANKIGGSFFVLDEKRDISRVVSGKKLQVDFSGLNNNIEEDLRLRDFTINSMAVPLDSMFNNNIILLDPLNGKTDINNRVLRASSQNSINGDPLRIMRAFRFSSSFGFSMDEELLNQIRKHCEDLNKVSIERVRGELFMVLEMSAAYKTLMDMDNAGVLKSLFPEIESWKGFFQGGWHVHDLFDHSMNSVGMAEEILNRLDIYFPEYGKNISDYMAEEIEENVTRRGLVKIAAFMHDSGKLFTRTMENGRGRFIGHEKKSEEFNTDLARRLKMGRRTELILRGLTANHMRILGLSKLSSITPRAKYRFFRDNDIYGLDLLILSLADAMATPVEDRKFDEFKGLIGNLAGYYFEEFVKEPPAPLLTGKDIMGLLEIPQGKEIGRMKEAIREGEAMGKISSKKEAVDYLKKMFL